jgi:two-component system, chemotaxis family, protein-glutamate methylesterase/glutaminase
VAIGLSADGLMAIRTVLEALPAGLEAAILIVLHRAPQSIPRLAQLIARGCALPVKEAGPTDVLRSGQVYIAPPDTHLVVVDRRLQLSQTERVNFARPSIDVLFESVARVYGPRAVGVILSGGGRDGARGLQAIRVAGGTAIVQDLREARWGRLPARPAPPAGSTSSCPWRRSGPRSWPWSPGVRPTKSTRRGPLPSPTLSLDARTDHLPIRADRRASAGHPYSRSIGLADGDG